ncbi:MAG: YdcF family protein [Clostridium sp.]|nr:YdcF family protein [Clostridium sp.]
MKKNWDLFLGIALIIYIILLSIMSGTKFAFSEGILFIAALFIIYHFIKDKLKKKKTLFKTLKVIISLGIIGIISIEGFIIAYPKKNKDNSDYILILGAGLINGKNPSLVLKGRLDAALESINDYGNTSYIVVSGGQGNDERISEAEAMKNYLVNHGVEEERIIMEDKSTSTNENFKFSKEKIEEHSKKDIDELNIKIITTDFHSLRSSILAKNAGYKNITSYSSPTKWYMAPVLYLREAFALIKSIIFDL